MSEIRGKKQLAWHPASPSGDSEASRKPRSMASPAAALTPAIGMQRSTGAEHDASIEPPWLIGLEAIVSPWLTGGSCFEGAEGASALVFPLPQPRQVRASHGKRALEKSLFRRRTEAAVLNMEPATLPPAPPPCAGCFMLMNEALSIPMNTAWRHGRRGVLLFTPGGFPYHSLFFPPSLFCKKLDRQSQGLLLLRAKMKPFPLVLIVFLSTSLLSLPSPVSCATLHQKALCWQGSEKGHFVPPLVWLLERTGGHSSISCSYCIASTHTTANLSVKMWEWKFACVPGTR